MRQWRRISFFACCVAGCASKPPQIVYPSTAAYEARVNTLNVKPDKARAIAARAIEPEKFWDGPLCLIDEWYVFGEPHKTARIDLTGTYVNGVNGTVERRESTASLFGDDSMLGILRSFPANMPTSVSGARSLR